MESSREDPNESSDDTTERCHLIQPSPDNDCSSSATAIIVPNAAPKREYRRGSGNPLTCHTESNSNQINSTFKSSTSSDSTNEDCPNENLLPEVSTKSADINRCTYENSSVKVSNGGSYKTNCSSSDYSIHVTPSGSPPPPHENLAPRGYYIQSINSDNDPLSVVSCKIDDDDDPKPSYATVNMEVVENYSSDHEIPTSSSFLLDKSSGSGQVTTTPNGSCLRGSSKGGGSNSSGPHVQFESPTPSQANLVGKAGGKGGVYSYEQYNGVERSGYYIKIHPERGGESNGIFGGINKKKKRQRQISGSSSASCGSSTSILSEGSEQLQRKAPDGGWGWVVVMASFLVHCIADGVTMSFGVLFIELLDYFKESKSFTSLVGSLFMAIPLLAGPIASSLTDHFGCRKVTIMGSVIACIGFFLSAFANSIPLLLVTLGLITGLGLAVCYVAAIVIVAFYFEKKRSLATGIAVAGSGIGTFVFAPFLQYLIDTYGWRGCLIIVAGIFLNMCVCGAVMRDLEWTKKQRSDNKRNHHSNMSSNSRPESACHSFESLSDIPATPHSPCPPVNELRRLVQSGDVSALLSPDTSPSKCVRSSSMLLLPTFISRTHTLPVDIIPCINSRANAFEFVSQMYPHLLCSSLAEQIDILPPMLSDTKLYKMVPGTPPASTLTTADMAVVPSSKPLTQNPLPAADDTKTNIVDQQEPQVESSTPCYDGNKISASARQVPIAAKASLSTPRSSLKVPSILTTSSKERLLNALTGRGSTSGPSGGGGEGCLPTSQSASVLPPYTAAPLRNMRINRQSMTYRGAMLNIHRYRLRASSCPDIYRNSMIIIDDASDKSLSSWLDDLKASARSCLHMPYCLDPGYIVFSLSNFILYLFYDTVYMYLVDYAQENGVADDLSANLISIIGFLNCIGMVGMGYIGDKAWSPLLLIYNVSMVVCGLSIIFMPFVTTYWILALLAALFGFFISANYALTSVILVELISLDSFTKAYGMLLLIQGMANLLGPPLVGWMRDTTEDYVLPFVVSGVSIIGCGLMLFIIPLLSSRSKSSTSSSSSSSSSSSHSRESSIKARGSVRSSGGVGRSSGPVTTEEIL